MLPVFWPQEDFTVCLLFPAAFWTHQAYPQHPILASTLLPAAESSRLPASGLPRGVGAAFLRPCEAHIHSQELESHVPLGPAGIGLEFQLGNLS